MENEINSFDNAGIRATGSSYGMEIARGLHPSNLLIGYFTGKGADYIMDKYVNIDDEKVEKIENFEKLETEAEVNHKQNETEAQVLVLDGNEKSKKQEMDTRSSTAVELVTGDNVRGLILWTKFF